MEGHPYQMVELNVSVVQTEAQWKIMDEVELIRLAKEQGLSLTGPDGLLKQLTKTVLETALNEEMTEHLGYEKHDPAVSVRTTSVTAPDRRRC